MVVYSVDCWVVELVVLMAEKMAVYLVVLLVLMRVGLWEWLPVVDSVETMAEKTVG
jgi:hypothetical protein